MNKTDALQAVLDSGKFVFVVYGVYSDRSAAKILGVYTDQSRAEDAVKLLKSGESMFQVNYAKVALNQAYGVMLEP